LVFQWFWMPNRKKFDMNTTFCCNYWKHIRRTWTWLDHQDTKFLHGQYLYIVLHDIFVHAWLYLVWWCQDLFVPFTNLNGEMFSGLCLRQTQHIGMTLHTYNWQNIAATSTWLKLNWMYNTDKCTQKTTRVSSEQPTKLKAILLYRNGTFLNTLFTYTYMVACQWW